MTIHTEVTSITQRQTLGALSEASGGAPQVLPVSGPPNPRCCRTPWVFVMLQQRSHTLVGGGRSPPHTHIRGWFHYFQLIFCPHYDRFGLSLIQSSARGSSFPGVSLHHYCLFTPHSPHRATPDLSLTFLFSSPAFPSAPLLIHRAAPPPAPPCPAPPLLALQSLGERRH